MFFYIILISAVVFFHLTSNKNFKKNHSLQLFNLFVTRFEGEQSLLNVAMVIFFNNGFQCFHSNDKN